MKQFIIILLAVGMVCTSLFGQPVMPVGLSSEWEATGFNNGRRVVRDCADPNNTRFHIVWHSQEDPNQAPSATGCDIYYAVTDEMGTILVGPTNLTKNLDFLDNRYPSIAIENDGIDTQGDWRNYNDIHVVWQGREWETTLYDVYHETIPVNNPPMPPIPFDPNAIDNLSVTSSTDSLVPAVAINMYGSSPVTNQQIHVVWQEEDWSPDWDRGTDAAFSEIAYTQSMDSGVTWGIPQMNKPPMNLPWENLTQTELNSQMPTISCSLDTFFGFPIYYSDNPPPEGLPGDCNYDADDVHVAYNEDLPDPDPGIHIYYKESLNNGGAWFPPIDVTMKTNGDGYTKDGYPSIARGMFEDPLNDFNNVVHIVFMRKVERHEPLVYGYFPGVDPTDPNCFPGPCPGMYNVRSNDIIYWSNLFPSPPPLPDFYPQGNDREFPTVALDRERNLTVNWQEYMANRDPDPMDYEIMRTDNLNGNPPARPLNPLAYGNWTTPNNDSMDPENDDLFPNLAHKKVATYKVINPPYNPTGFTEVWTKVQGIGASAAMAGAAKDVVQKDNVTRDPLVN